MSAIGDAELALFRQTVNCAAVLERLVGGWKLDVRQSTKRALKYRRGPGEIIIVNHDGHGWWDATGNAKGDVFNLVQHLDPSFRCGGCCGASWASRRATRKPSAAGREGRPTDRLRNAGPGVPVCGADRMPGLI